MSNLNLEIIDGITLREILQHYVDSKENPKKQTYNGKLNFNQCCRLSGAHVLDELTEFERVALQGSSSSWILTPFEYTKLVNQLLDTNWRMIGEGDSYVEVMIALRPKIVDYLEPKPETIPSGRKLSFSL